MLTDEQMREHANRAKTAERVRRFRNQQAVA
jgi:hypothetical protein